MQLRLFNVLNTPAGQASALHRGRNKQVSFHSCSHIASQDFLFLRVGLQQLISAVLPQTTIYQTAGLTCCGSSRRHKQAHSCNTQPNVLQQVSSRAGRKTAGGVQMHPKWRCDAGVQALRPRHSPNLRTSKKLLTSRASFVSVRASNTRRRRNNRLIEGWISFRESIWRRGGG